MKARREIEVDGVDLLLLAAIAILAAVTVVLLFPAIWDWCRVALNVRNWPYCVWTCIGVVVLCVLVWLRSRYE
jgi:hypothetical protein